MSATLISTASAPFIRRVYHGSCHCKQVSYRLAISQPPSASEPYDASSGIPPPPPPDSVRFYKCNCSTCHKMGYLHVRVPDPAREFCLLSPPDALRDYVCGARRIHWYFCAACGVRCFAASGAGRVVDVDVEGQLTRAWMVKEEDDDGAKTYLSVNGLTLEPGQEGLDLRELKNKGWIQYLDRKDGTHEDRFDYPHEGGTW